MFIKLEKVIMSEAKHAGNNDKPGGKVISQSPRPPRTLSSDHDRRFWIKAVTW